MGRRRKPSAPDAARDPTEKSDQREKTEKTEKTEKREKREESQCTPSTAAKDSKTPTTNENTNANARKQRRERGKNKRQAVPVIPTATAIVAVPANTDNTAAAREPSRDNSEAQSTQKTHTEREREPRKGMIRVSPSLLFNNDNKKNESNHNNNNNNNNKKEKENILDAAKRRALESKREREREREKKRETDTLGDTAQQETERETEREKREREREMKVMQTRSAVRFCEAQAKTAFDSVNARSDALSPRDVWLALQTPFRGATHSYAALVRALSLPVTHTVADSHSHTQNASAAVCEEQEKERDEEEEVRRCVASAASLSLSLLQTLKIGSNTHTQTHTQAQDVEVVHAVGKEATEGAWALILALRERHTLTHTRAHTHAQGVSMLATAVRVLSEALRRLSLSLRDALLWKKSLSLSALALALSPHDTECVHTHARVSLCFALSVQTHTFTQRHPLSEELWRLSQWRAKLVHSLHTLALLYAHSHTHSQTLALSHTAEQTERTQSLATEQHETLCGFLESLLSHTQSALSSHNALTHSQKFSFTEHARLASLALLAAVSVAHSRVCVDTFTQALSVCERHWRAMTLCVLEKLRERYHTYTHSQTHKDKNNTTHTAIHTATHTALRQQRGKEISFAPSLSHFSSQSHNNEKACSSLFLSADEDADALYAYVFALGGESDDTHSQHTHTKHTHTQERELRAMIHAVQAIALDAAQCVFALCVCVSSRNETLRNSFRGVRNDRADTNTHEDTLESKHTHTHTLSAEEERSVSVSLQQMQGLSGVQDCLSLFVSVLSMCVGVSASPSLLTESLREEEDTLTRSLRHLLFSQALHTLSLAWSVTPVLCDSALLFRDTDTQTLRGLSVMSQKMESVLSAVSVTEEECVPLCELSEWRLCLSLPEWLSLPQWQRERSQESERAWNDVTQWPSDLSAALGSVIGERETHTLTQRQRDTHSSERDRAMSRLLRLRETLRTLSHSPVSLTVSLTQAHHARTESEIMFDSQRRPLIAQHSLTRNPSRERLLCVIPNVSLPKTVSLSQSVRTESSVVVTTHTESAPSHAEVSQTTQQTHATHTQEPRAGIFSLHDIKVALPTQHSHTTIPPPTPQSHAFSLSVSVWPLVIVDAANVAMRHGAQKVFSSRGVRIAMRFFAERGHRVCGFLPDYMFSFAEVGGRRRLQHLGISDSETNKAKMPDDVNLLVQMQSEVLLVATPAQDYDDAYCIAYARKHNALVVTNDKFRDYIEGFPSNAERAKAREWVNAHCISFTFAGDEFIPNPAFGKNKPSKKTK